MKLHPIIFFDFSSHAKYIITSNKNRSNEPAFDLVLVRIAVARNEGSDESCNCADSPGLLLSASTNYGYIDADQNRITMANSTAST